MLALFGSRRRAVEQAVLPLAARDALLRAHPHLDEAGTVLVAEGLRQWYRVAQLARGRAVAMPSQAVDDLWHAHIVCTRAYGAFCTQAFGRFLHHQPEAAMRPETAARNRGANLRTTYDLARRVEDVPLPLLFSIDARLGVPGRRYLPACGSAYGCTASGAVCLAHLPVARPGDGGSGSGCGSTSSDSGGWGSSDGCGSDSGSVGGGGGWGGGGV